MMSRNPEAISNNLARLAGNVRLFHCSARCPKQAAEGQSPEAAAEAERLDCSWAFGWLPGLN